MDNSTVLSTEIDDIDIEHADVASISNTDKVLINDRFTIFPSRPLKEYDCHPAKSYEVEDSKKEYGDLYALALSPSYHPRMELMQTIFAREIEHMVRIVGWGIEYWPLEKKYIPICVLKKPKGQKLSNILRQTKGVSADVLINNLIIPVAEFLKEFSQLGTAHRNIRLDNIYWDGHEESKMLLGPCFCCPPAMSQPVIYEDIGSIQCLPVARGTGSVKNDIYALGVVVGACLSEYPDLCANMKEKEIILSKLEFGSIYTLFGNTQFAPNIYEFIRASVYDNFENRWNADDLMSWLLGKRLSPKNIYLPRKARKGFLIGRYQCFTAREVAYHMWENWEESRELIKSGDLDAWLRTELGDPTIMEDFTLIRIGIRESSNMDTVLAKVLIILDPHESPIRLKSFAGNIDGIGHFFSYFFQDKSAQDLVEDITNMDLVNSKLDAILGEGNKEDKHLQSLVSRFYNSAEYRISAMLGNGMNRFCYELNSSSHCMSQHFANDYIFEMQSVLPTLDRHLSSSNATKPDFLLDDDLLTFIAARARRRIDQELKQLHTSRNAIKSIEGRSDGASAGANATLIEARIVASLQQRENGNAPFHYIAEYYEEKLQSVIEKFNSRPLKREIKNDLKLATKSGIIQQMILAVTNASKVELDSSGYEVAVAKYSQDVRRLNEIKMKLYKNKEIADHIGYQIAVMISGIISIITSIIIFLIYLF